MIPAYPPTEIFVTFFQQEGNLDFSKVPRLGEGFSLVGQSSDSATFASVLESEESERAVMGIIRKVNEVPAPTMLAVSEFMPDPRHFARVDEITKWSAGVSASFRNQPGEFDPIGDLEDTVGPLPAPCPPCPPCAVPGEPDIVLPEPPPGSPPDYGIPTPKPPPGIVLPEPPPGSPPDYGIPTPGSPPGIAYGAYGGSHTILKVWK